MPETVSARRILYEDRSEKRIVRVWATTDALTAGLDCHVLAAGWPGASSAELVRLLENQKIRHGLDLAAIEELVAAVRGGRTEASCVAARGSGPEHGRDGALDFIVPPSSEEARYQHQPGSGRIDFRETNLVQNVLAGEALAIEIPPKPGTDGVNVFGRRLAAAQGRPARFKVGKGARFDEARRQVFAQLDGRVVWDAGTVSVSDSYHVRGPVDYSIGNIAFVGEVVVDGEVLDGFSVRAGRRLTVGGNLGACQADSEGDLILKGGVFGKGKARLRAKGGLSARFLNDCQAEAAGSVVIEREALNSTVLTNRRLLMTAGTFTGGAASALGGADFDTLGSAMGVLTKVAVGTDYNLVRRQAEISGRIAVVDESTAKIEGFLKPLLADRRRMTRLLERRREDVEQLVAALRDLRGERATLAAELEALAESAARGAVPQVNIRRVLHPGVLLEIGSVRHRARQALAGPVTVVEDRAKGALRTIEFRELPAEKAEPGGAGQ